jgi:type II secretory pathway component PulK
MKPSMTNEGKGLALLKNNHGVALIIVLLVTALLIALIFEFAYGTRISLRAAVNFRDSQRAYYLARSGVNFVGRLQSSLTGTAQYDYLEQREWQTVPFLPGNDAELRVKWDDEAGKIQINDAQTAPVKQAMLGKLFEMKGIDRAVLDEIMDSASNINKMSLLTGLHRFMNDDDYNKVYQLLRVNPNPNANQANININTAPEDVLLSLNISPADVSSILDDRKKKEWITDYTNDRRVNVKILDHYPSATYYLTNTSNNFKVYSYATVGGYTKQVEADITRSSSGFTVNYWRAL